MKFSIEKYTNETQIKGSEVYLVPYWAKIATYLSSF